MCSNDNEESSYGSSESGYVVEASHYARPKASLTIFYWLFSAHFFGLSTKFGHSITRPLDLDGHSVNRPLSQAMYDTF
jgi:hypothetical protein